MKQRSHAVEHPAESPAHESARILPFRGLPATGPPPAGRPRPAQNPMAQPDDFTQPEDSKTYRDRMLANLAAVIVLGLLMAAGLWLADTMAALRKNEDCALSGRHDCVPLDLNERK